MPKSVIAVLSVFALALTVMPIAVSADQSGEEYTAPKAEKAVLLKQDGLAAGSGLEANAIHFKLPPGFKGGRHYHTGDVFVYVLSGSLSIETDEGTRTINAGEAYYEIPGMKMIGENLSADSSTEILVIQVGPKGEPMMVKAD
jgi:quercetin dioxygenase-like cupin family protein